MRAVVLTEVNAFLAVEEIPTPAVLGHEISGTVATVGPEVAGLAEGTRVVSSFIMPCGRCTQCAQGRDDLCSTFFKMNRLEGHLYDGATRVVLRVRTQALLPVLGCVNWPAFTRRIVASSL